MNDLQDNDLEKSISTEKISSKIKHDDDFLVDESKEKNTDNISKNDSDISSNVNTDIPNADNSVKTTRKYAKKPRSEKQLKQLEKSRLKYQAMAREKKKKKEQAYENLIREKIYNELNLSDEDRKKLSDKTATRLKPDYIVVKADTEKTPKLIEKPVSVMEKPVKTTSSLSPRSGSRIERYKATPLKPPADSDIDDFDNFLKNYEKLKNIKNMILDEEMKKSNFNNDNNSKNDDSDNDNKKSDFNDMIFNSRYNFNRRF